ncbi:hypothetical protein AB0M47_40420 [Hamadaea sp. NPDC051192]|uniref:hypothetical protein n=1 Tax=Hamadaea sp. NPDC051192 TaxID=3154940 RepID=UPI00343CD75B
MRNSIKALRDTLRYSAWAASAGLVLAGAAACGADDAVVTGGDHADASGSVVLHLTYAVTGDRPVSGTVDAEASAWQGGLLLEASSCAGYSAGGADSHDVKTFVLPESDRDTIVDGKNVYLVLSVANYNGPGSYEGTKVLNGIISGDTPAIWIDGRDEGHGFIASYDGDSTSKVVVKNDGSGSWTFADFWLSESTGSNRQTVSGTVSWTCEEV